MAAEPPPSRAVDHCMPILLSRGEFFGRAVASGRCGDFAMSETRYARGAFLPWHTHEEGYLTFVLSGGYRERLEHAARTCAARSVVFHPPGDTHEDDFAEQPARCLNVVLGQPFARRLGEAGELYERGGVVASEGVASIGRRLSSELNRGDSAAGLIVEGLLLELFGMLARSEESRCVPAWLREAHAIATRGFAEKLQLQELAATVGVHPVHLARTFRRHFGVSVGEHVRALRLAHARERIAAGVPLAVVAAEAGFADQSHLTKAFRRGVGVAPSEYRRMVARAAWDG